MTKRFVRGGRNLATKALLLVALVSTFLVAGPPSQAEAQAIVPFDCDGTPYIMQNSRMFQVVPDPANPGLFLFEEVGVLSQYGNSIGYDPTTNLVYGVRKPGGVWTVETYDATWNVVNSNPIVEAPGSPTYPSDGSNYAGTVMGDGSYIVATYNAAVPGFTKHNLWSIDAATGLATHIGQISPQSPSLADFSYNPLDGFLYHVASGSVHQLNPLTGDKMPLGAAPGLGGGFGSSYFDAAGNLYVHRNSDGNLYKIGGVGTGTNTVELVATTGRVSGADAASCVGEIDLLKDVVDAAGDPVPLADRVYAPGDIVNYEFTIINNALPAGAQQFSLCDALPADGRTYTGNASSATTISFTTPFAAGATDFCLDVTVESSLWADPSQPGGDPVTVIIEVEIGADMLPGEYENQATLENPFDPGDLVLSDDPGDVSDPEDPTTIQVTGEFTVTKQVATHPDGATTDTFTVVIACTDADAVAFDVAPASFLDAAGDPWPGAGTNTFPIRDGESPRVTDLPAGSTCTAVESPVPAAYALVATSSDSLVTDGGEIVVDERPSEEVVGLTNRTGSFSLTKFTEPPVAAAAPLDLTGSFTIRVECRFNGAQVLPPTDFVVDASTAFGSGATGTLSYPDLPLLPHGAECRAEEVAINGWTDTGGSVSFMIDEAEPANAEFTNVRQVAPLDVSKTIAGLPAGDDPTSFDFEITVTCVGGFVNASETFGPFTIRTDSPQTVPNLPVGTSCTVVETPQQEFAPVYSPAGGLTTVEAAGAAVAIENVTGTFVVRKDTVVSTALYPVDPTGTFTVRIVCTDIDDIEIHNQDHTIAATDTAPAAGATGGLTYEDASLPLLPPGTTCVITEDVPAGWTLTSPNDVEIVIPADGVRPTAVLTNERVIADLSIAKDVVGAPPGIDAANITFPVTVTCTGPFTAAVERTGVISEASPFLLPDLPVGSVCTAVETPNASFVTTSTPANAQASVDDDSNQTITFANETTWFDVTKNTNVPATHPLQDDDTFTIAIVCMNGGLEVLNTSVTLTTVDGTASLAPADIPLLPTGSDCTVTETPLAGWTVAANDLTTTTSSTPGNVVFTNTRDTGDLVITKTVDGLPAGANAADYSFLVDIVCTGDFDSNETPATQYSLLGQLLTTAGLTIADLPTGANCTVAEQAAAGFAATYPLGQTATVSSTPTTVDVVNTTSTFSISKTTSAPADVDEDATFNFSWICDDVPATTGSTSLATSAGAAATAFAANGLPLVAPGTTCTVTEAANSGWTADALTIDVTTSANAVADAAFVNTRDVGSLTVTKSIVGLASGQDPTTFSFDITITCTSDDFVGGSRVVTDTITTDTQITVNDLPTGATCNVEETLDPAWTPLYDPVGGDLTIAEGANDVSIVNSTGELIVFKESFVDSDHPIDPEAVFNFDITCSLGGSQVFSQILPLDASTLTASGGALGGIGYDDLGTTFAPGTTCVVTEQPSTGWTITSTNPASISITADGGQTAEFTNERNVADLEIVKTINGIPAGMDPAGFGFIVNVVCNGGGLPVDYAIDGLPLVAGTPTVIENLPTGASCVATETADSRFAPTLPAAPSIIDDDGETLPIVNTARTLTINKTATSPGSFPVDLSGEFTIEVACDNGYTASLPITTDAAGVGSITYPTTALIADGTSCEVTEPAPPAGWTLDSTTGPTVVLTTDGTVSFTNTRDVGTLDITKSLVGYPAGLTPPSFTVDVVCSGGFASAETPTTQHTISDVVLTTAGATVTDLPIGTSCQIAEDPSNPFLPTYPDGDTRVIDADGETVAIVNETSTFDIAKTVVAPAGVATDQAFDFSWVCNDPANSTGSATIIGAGTFADAAVLPIVPVGTECVVTEATAGLVGWTATAAQVTVTTATGGPVTASFENVRETASLSITKQIQGFPADFNPDLDDELFPVTVTCTGDFAASPAIFARSISVNTPATVDDLPTGADCSVVEDDDPRFFVIYSPTSTTIATGENTLGVINVTGELMVQKNTIVNSEHPIDPLGEFTVRIVCSNASGEYFNETRTVQVDTQVATNGTGGISYADLPLFSNGSECSVTEEAIPTGWTETTDPAPGTITIDATAPTTVVLENTRDTGDLVITKTIDGLPTGLLEEDFVFSVTVTCNHPDLPANYAVGPFDVAVGSPHTIVDLPTGASCTAVEAPDPRFAPTLPAAPAVITTADAAIAITNTTTFFSITKAASSTSALPIDLAESFVFTIVCGAEAPVQVTITTANNGLGSADHTDGLPLVAPGTECTVTETAAALWTETSTVAPFTATPGTSPQLDFTNERDLTTLTIDKTIVGLPAPLAAADYTFDITISCTGGFSPLSDPHVITETLSTTAATVIPGIPANADCTVIETLPANSPFTSSASPASGAANLANDETVSFTNTTSTFAISKTTVVPANADPDGTFTFTWSCSDVAGSTGTATITTVAGVGTFDFADGLTIVPPGTVCSVDETNVPSGWVVTQSPIEVTTASAAPAVAAFENTREAADLTISKTILGLSDGDQPEDFTFFVDVTCTGDFPGGELVLLNQPISTDAPILIPNLPTGAVCTAVEQPDVAFAAIYGPENPAGAGGQATITNEGAGIAITNLTGRVAWVKQTVAAIEHAVDPVETFTFSVECVTIDNTPVTFANGSTTLLVDVTTSNVTAAGAVGVPDENDFPLLAAGSTCTVEETPTSVNGWTLTSSPNPVIVEISPDPNPGVFTNTRDAADLTITKVIEGLPASLNAADFSFEVTVTCDHADLIPSVGYTVGPLTIRTDAPITVANLPTGADCTVVETADPDFATTYTNQQVTIVDGGVTSTITNSTGTLTIIKTTEAPGSLGIDLAGTFTFDVVCASGDNASDVAITTSAAGTGSIGYPDIDLLIPEGTNCTVSEDGPATEWTVSEQAVSDIVSGGLAQTEFTNTRKTAPLTVTKIIEGAPSNADLDAFLFDLTVDCTGDFVGGSYAATAPQFSVDVPYTLQDLPTGAACSVTEIADSRFSTSYSPDPATVTIAETTGGQVVVTNSTGELIIAKETIVPANRPVDPTGTFSYQIDCTAPDSSSVFSGVRSLVVDDTNATVTGATGGLRYDDLPLMPNGTQCTITEDVAALDGVWTLTSANSVTITVSSTDPETANFENTRDVATLRVAKELAGLPLGAVGQFDDEAFTVSIVCTGDFANGSPYNFSDVVSVNTALEIDNLPTGASCTITEADDGRFAASYLPQTVTIGAAGAASVITNTTGELVLMKETVIPSTHAINAVEPFDFRLICTAPGAASPSFDAIRTVTPETAIQTGAIGGIRYDQIPLLADGTSCVITEEGLPADWTLTSSTPMPIIIDSAAPITAAFVNTHDVGDLEITKTTLGLPPEIAASDLTFAGVAICNHKNLITDYPVAFTIAGDGTHLIEDLPANAVCTVTETVDTRFDTGYAPVNGQVTIVKDDVVIVDITNETSYFDLRKTVIAPGNGEINLVADFTFTVNCTNGFSDEFVLSTNAAGTAQITHLDGLPLLPPTATCTIAEPEADLPTGWVFASPATGQSELAAGDDDRGVVEFTNQRQETRLTVTKTIEGLPASIDATLQTFPVTITCTGDFVNGDTQVYNETVAPGADIVIENLPTGATCTAVEEPNPAYRTTTVPANGEVTLPLAGSTIAITNATAVFEITKATTVDSTLAVDPDATFNFIYECSDPSGLIIATDTVSVTTTSASGQAGFNPLPFLADGTVCVITELPTTNWTATSPTEVTLTLDSDATQTAAFTNDRDLTSLEVTKSFDGLPASVDPDGLVFDIEVTCTGGFSQPGTGDDTETIAAQISTVATTTIDGIPVDADCTVVEAADSRFATTYSPAAGSVAMTGAQSVEVINTTSTFGITKATIVAPGLEDDATFSFDWSCNDPAVSNGTASITTVDSSGSFTFGAEAPLVVPGTICTVDETTLPAGWVVTQSPIQATTAADSVATTDFVNTRSTADLTITKTVLGLPDGQVPTDFSFRVDISCTGDFPGGVLELNNQVLTPGTDLVVPDLPTNAVCTVVEQPDPRFAVVYGPASGTVIIDDNGAGVSVANLTGRVTFVKQTIVADSVINSDEVFEFQVECVNPATGEVLFDDIVPVRTDTATAAGGIGIPDLESFPLVAVGTECTIAELGPPTGWTLAASSPNPASITISTEPQVAAFENVRDVADLIITKTIDGLPDTEVAATYSFDVTVVCTHPDLPQPNLTIGPLPIRTNNPLQIANLPTGASCDITETADARFRTSYDNATVIIADAGADATITNTTGVLNIVKQAVAPGDLPISLIDTFTFDIDCTNGYSDSLNTTTNELGVGTIGYPATPLIADGTDCTIAETPLTSGWTPTTPSVDVTIVNGEATADFENTRATADLTVNKLLEGVPVSLDLSGEPFDITISCTGDFVDGTYSRTTTVSEVDSHSVTDLPTGAECTVVEASDDRFSTTYSPVTGTTTVDANTAVTITNTTSTLEIVKTTSAADGVDANGTFTFAWNCAGKTGTTEITTEDGGGTWTFDDGLPLIPPQTDCVVTETDLPTGWSIDAPQVTVSTSASDAVAAEFVNTREVGNLTITKTVLGPIADPEDLVFTVDIECTGQFATGTTLVLEDQPIGITAPIIVEDLPTGAVCTVSEDEAAEFRTVYSPAIPTVTIESSGAAVAITNLTGQVSLVKQSIVTGLYDLDPVSTFLFDITCNNIPALVLTDVPVETIQPNASGAIGTADPAIFGSLPDGTECEIREVDAGTGWTRVSAETQTITISADSTDTAFFENTRDRADLTITKVIDGLPAGTSASSYVFDVNVACTHDDLPGVLQVGPLTLSTNTSTVVPDLPTGAECVVTETETPQFRTSYDNTTVTITDDGAAVEITNTTGVLTLVKTATAAGSLPIDLAATFTFDISCSNGFADVLQITTNSAGFGTVTYPAIDLIADASTCSVDEIDLPTGWTTPDSSASTSIISGTGLTAFANTRTTADLEVTKLIEGVPAGFNLDDVAFDISVTCSGDFVGGTFAVDGQISVDQGFTVAAVPTGATCQVVETTDERFTTSYSPTQGQLTIGANANAVSVTNSTASFIITKTTTNASDLPVDADGEFTFSYVCTVEDSDAISGSVAIRTVGSMGMAEHPDLPLVPSGSTCVVTEASVERFTPIGATEVSLDVDSDNPGQFDFTNDRNLGDLTISKAVLGLPDAVQASDLVFAVDIRCSGGFTGDDTYETLGVPLRTTGPTVLENLPEGARCLITEVDDARFTPSYAPASPSGVAAATIEQTGSGVSIVNATGDILLVKQTTAPSTYPIDTTGTFDFAVTCTNAAGVTVYQDVHQVVVTTATASGSMGSLGYDALPLLAEGTTCSVEEINVPVGWSASDAGPTDLRISPNGSAPDVLTFENTRDTGSLTLTNVLVGLPAGADPADYSFTLVVTCAGPGFPDGHEIRVEVNHGESVTLTDLPTGSICSVLQIGDTRFAPQVPSGPFTITAGTAASVDVVNRTGTFDITKRTAASAGTAVTTLVGTFSFTVSCENGYLGTHAVTTDRFGQGSSVWPELPLLAAGTSCTVDETEEAGWIAFGGTTRSLTIVTGESTNVDYLNVFINGTVRAVTGPDALPGAATTVATEPVTLPLADTPVPALPVSPLAHTGRESRGFASVALLLLGIGFAALGTSRRRLVERD